MVTGVGVGLQNGGSSSCHMSMHLMTDNFKTVSGCDHLLETNELKGSAFVRFSAASFIMVTTFALICVKVVCMVMILNLYCKYVS